mmetsp:Transcript_19682/g.54743  ORF Transcript_19682/g.54743 Transcript_19682/m.54743 type:complete len:82 (-) Transcript_19682:250-495(-)
MPRRVQAIAVGAPKCDTFLISRVYAYQTIVTFFATCSSGFDSEVAMAPSLSQHLLYFYPFLVFHPTSISIHVLKSSNSPSH